MSANTTYYVKVLVPKLEWRTVSALTGEDAIAVAKEDKEVLFVQDVYHWSDESLPPEAKQ